jgi:hypothetical protein
LKIKKQIEENQSKVKNKKLEREVIIKEKKEPKLI